MADIKTDINTFLKSNNILTLATHGQTPWACTLYYGMDEDFHMYLVTDPESEHGQHLKTCNDVAFCIFDSHTKVTESKFGVQGKGKCIIVKNIGEILKGLSLWHRFNPGVEQRITLDMVKKALDTKIYKIEPSYLKFFNKELYGAKEYGAINLHS